ncbi:Phosphoribosyl 1,2-cyclic phosphodiesterase [Thermoanaerobacter uzonensis DSM 18761]|uniref:Phosphoribosyl 1,2-cyclic phosphodiesterase n=1 Tax=Thermoanaerobacter uzonensis DSM 18761 TaxID=1123369 RepID=A0A1M5B0B3_9THEO|nr:MBL fold metallo-hydrolase [Thermoanaerobacter uzonensis]SHF35890.1 Phosphoribosyl 1,2-cyclic phosphodiesterase [Thermoanaerobacter uzonensis DSM 18761]
MKFCSLRSGSSGNAIYINHKDVHILVDAGLSGRTIEKALFNIGINPKSLSAILITHEHKDHIIGAGVLSRRYNIPIYANKATWEVMEKDIKEISEKNKLYFTTGEEFEIGDVKIMPFKKSHDAVEPVGFSFKCGDKKISIATDLGYMTKGVANHLIGSDVVLLEANHDIEMLMNGSYPWPLKKRILSNLGHLSNDAAADALLKLFKMKAIGMAFLGHLSQNNNRPELAFATVTNALKKSGVKFEVHMALRNIESDVVEI